HQRPHQAARRRQALPPVTRVVHPPPVVPQVTPRLPHHTAGVGSVLRTPPASPGRSAAVGPPPPPAHRTTDSLPGSPRTSEPTAGATSGRPLRPRSARPPVGLFAREFS